MNRLKIFIVLLFLALATTPSAFDWNTSSHSLNPMAVVEGVQSTDQANRTSGSGVDVTESKAVDWEGSDPDSDANFSFDAEVDPKNATDSKEPTTAISKNSAGTQKAGATADGTDAACWIPITNAPADFDNKTNDPTFVSQADFEDVKKDFEAVEEIDDGIGPVYNAQSCRECHQNPVTGGISQINELRAGHNQKAYNPWGQLVLIFVDAPGGSLINDRAIPTANTITPPFFSAKIQERIPPLLTAGIVSGPDLVNQEPVRTFRTSLNVLGDGFLEAVPNGTLLAIAAFQNALTGGVVHGQAIAVPVLEANIPANPDCANPNLPCKRRIGRFGWKDQHASLLSFSGDAYLNEMGITNFLVPNENTSLGRFVGFGSGFDSVPDPLPLAEDDMEDFRKFALFMRATKAPPRDPDIINSPQYAASVERGRKLFSKLPATATDSARYSCAMCHVPAILTAPPCTIINNGQFVVPNALGNKILRPFSDGLLHDIGTGDGIVQNGPQEDTVAAKWSTRNKVRTPPLWGVRTRDRLMHDGNSFTFLEAIQRHKNEAQSVTDRFNALPPCPNLPTGCKDDVIRFLESL